MGRRVESVIGNQLCRCDLQASVADDLIGDGDNCLAAFRLLVYLLWRQSFVGKALKLREQMIVEV
jgi:hypothetical protein